VLHELFGLTDDIRQQADRLAAAGYLAVAPDLYSAGGARRCLLSTFRALWSGSGAAVEDIEAVRVWLSGRQDCTGKVGVIGFCLGGGFALLAAARGFDAAAPNYGPLPKDPARALAGACPVVGSYGAKDRALRGAAAELEAALTDAGVVHDVKSTPRPGTASSTGTAWDRSRWSSGSVASATTRRPPKMHGGASCASSTTTWQRPERGSRNAAP